MIIAIPTRTTRNEYGGVIGVQGFWLHVKLVENDNGFIRLTLMPSSLCSKQLRLFGITKDMMG